MSLLGLAKVKKLPPQLIRSKDKSQIDLDTVKAVVGHRFQVLSHYYQQVVKPMLKELKCNTQVNKEDKRLLARAKALFKREEILLSTQAKEALNDLLRRFESLKLVYQYRQNLQNIWLKTATTQKELIEALQAWCKQAEESGIESLKEFANTVKSYQLIAAAI